MSEMAEYINDNPKAIAPGEPIVFDNQCGSPFEVGTAVVFRKDGDYFVSVRGGVITVRGIGEPAVRHGIWNPINRSNPAWAQFGIARYKCSECGHEELYARKRCPECGAEMGRDGINANVP